MAVPGTEGRSRRARRGESPRAASIALRLKRKVDPENSHTAMAKPYEVGGSGWRRDCAQGPIAREIRHAASATDGQTDTQRATNCMAEDERRDLLRADGRLGNIIIKAGRDHTNQLRAHSFIQPHPNHPGDSGADSQPASLPALMGGGILTDWPSSFSSTSPPTFLPPPL